ncbi:hypothetical protein J7E99_35540 [Streptomyces sp. ISL-44]|uniref:hypothetical protein n=1 Tax=Streptomyces sp. ISL-44 TaxID=2819184 RepID=UPI001BE772CD|nr:hypothetical protein [Streptomyces sp. ISL-44]MBT2545841.1 hypothetical protein [Streptomyces sp. ISL-44]
MSLPQAIADAAVLAATDQTSTAAFFNGNDAVVLRNGSTVIDSIGQIGVDPGLEDGDTNPSDAFDPAVEWDGFPVDTFSDLGTPPAVAVAPQVTVTAGGNCGANGRSIVETDDANANPPGTSAGIPMLIGCVTSHLVLVLVLLAPSSLSEASYAPAPTRYGS